ncbi:hypothetical protein [Roseibium alexandrii]|uniref:hypothetical protein n=1 Tax=Roseibium alexandrii TaxID=388408 RepID=UPI0037531244
MMFSTIETFARGKTNCGYSEDRLVQTPNHFGVLDGSRGPDALAKDAIQEILDSACAYIGQMPGAISLDQLIADLDKLVAVRKQAIGVSDFRSTGGFVFCLYSAHHREIWRVGDCKFRNNGFEKNTMFEAEAICAVARAMILKSKLNTGETPQSIMTAPDYPHLIDDLLVHEATFLNRANEPFGVGAIIGSGVPDDYIERIPARPGHLVITSDGYPVVCDTLAETEEQLNNHLSEDPLCMDQNRQCKGLAPGLQSFDDRTFISAAISD